jgi:teichuronic acid biosynthesis protein TuaE
MPYLILAIVNNKLLQNSSYFVISLKKYTLVLFAASLLGPNVIFINFGIFQLSPYRLLLLLSPFFLIKVKKSTFSQHVQSFNYIYFLFMLFWVLYSLVPLFWIKDFSGWFKIYTFLITGFITTWFINLFLTERADIINAMKIVEFFAVAFGLLATYEIISGNYLFVSERSLSYYQERSLLESTIGYRMPISVFGNPNDYALFLLFSVFNSFGLSKIRKSRVIRILSFLFAFFFIFLLFATQSRSAFLGLLLGIFIFCFVSLKSISKKNVYKFIIVILVISFLIPFIKDGKDLYLELMTFDISDGSDEVRLNLLRNGLDFILNTFFMGVGLGNIEYYMANFGYYPTYGVENIHNFWMEMLVSSGILVFSFYLIVYILNIYRLYRYSVSEKDAESRFISMIFLSFLLAFFITSSGASSLIYNEWIWPIIALIMSFVNVKSKGSFRALE